MINKEQIGSDAIENNILELESRITNELAYNWNLQEMSEIIGVGQTSLNLMLKRITGFTPGQYLMNLRISAVKEMLTNSNKNFTEIAFDCGFSSSQHFSSAFKQKTGYSPSEYIKRLD